MRWLDRVFKRAGLMDDRRVAEARLLASDVELDLVSARLGPDAAAVRALETGFDSDDPIEQVHAAIELRRLQLRELQGPELQRSLLHLRARYAAAVGQPAAEAVKPLEDCGDDVLMRAEVNDLLSRLKLTYSYVIERDMRVGGIRWWCLTLVATMLLALALLKSVPPFQSGPLYSPSNFFMVGAVGAIGAVVSIMHRSRTGADVAPLGNDPVAQISALRHGYAGIWLAGMIGPIMAITLLMLFASGVTEFADLTPDFILEPATAESKGTVLPEGQAHFEILDHRIWFRSAADTAKMLVWAFLAGFAERLVPDALDRITGSMKK